MSISLDQAIEVFVHGYAFGKSRTHPMVCELEGNVWRLFDAPRTRGDYRKEEFIASGIAPIEMHQAAESRGRGNRFICPITGVCADLRAEHNAYKLLNYRLLVTEGLFIHDLVQLPISEPPVEIIRVTDASRAAQLVKHWRMKEFPKSWLAEDSPLRQYAALINNEPVGWVASVTVGHCAWVRDLEVLPDFRRQGIGRTLMCRMLTDDKAAGLKASVLLASKVGALLYPTLGYELRGTLSAYCLKRI